MCFWRSGRGGEVVETMSERMDEWMNEWTYRVVPQLPHSVPSPVLGSPPPRYFSQNTFYRPPPSYSLLLTPYPPFPTLHTILQSAPAEPSPAKEKKGHPRHQPPGPRLPTVILHVRSPRPLGFRVASFLGMGIRDTAVRLDGCGLVEAARARLLC